MIAFWLGFLAFVVLMLAVDLCVLNKKDHEIGVKEALSWTGLWIFIALLFDVFIYFAYNHHLLGIGLHSGAADVSGMEAAMQYLTGYVVEKSLSMDNIFVMAAIFSYFKVPRLYQHRVLFWGILGALFLRGIFIIGGTELILHFHWVMYLFGAFLVFTALKMQFSKDDENMDPSKNLILRIAKNLFPVTEEHHGHDFFIVKDGKRFATPLFLALLVIESSDVLFAVDSIPAVFAVTLDPFLVFTSNIMAILGLRSLYFALAAMLGKFRYLKNALVVVLAFVGIKMLIADYYEVSSLVSLVVIFALLAAGIIASILIPRKGNK
ncbi:MAG: TerC family protein [Fibrobacteraceae bacterium]|nr:TerC family protein [Fibrobacteraceae bacterium]